MKNKILLVIAIIVIVCGIVFFFLLGRKEENIELNDYVITYTYGGGYGTYVSTATKTIELDNNGNVLIYVDIYGERELKEYRVSTNGIDDLANEMTKGKFSRLNNLIDDSCLDAGSSSLSIKSDDYEKKVVNYCMSNSTYSSAVNDFYNIVGRDRVDDFEDYIWDKYYEKY